MRREQYREATSEQIKAIARRHMAEEGTAAALSLRAIAREMGMTAPALYRYYANRDDLITALIVDAFNGLADALEGACNPNEGPNIQLMAVIMAYRQWALDHLTEFQLIYGTPIKGYAAPSEVTVPVATRRLILLTQLLLAAYAAGQFLPSADYQELPRELTVDLEAAVRAGGFDIPVMFPYLAVVIWSHLHGIIMLEVFGHLEKTVGDFELFYRREMGYRLQMLGLK